MKYQSYPTSRKTDAFEHNVYISQVTHKKCPPNN